MNISSRTTITAIVLTLNEESYLADCLKSLTWCNNVLVIDSFSGDRTVEIAEQMGAVTIQKPFINFAHQRNAAIDLVQSEWIFFLDADERVTKLLGNEIQQVLQDPTQNGWWIPRHNYINGKLFRYTGFFPDYQLRLFRKKGSRYDEKQKVHEIVSVPGDIGHLHHPIIHIYDGWEEVITHQKIFANLKAEQMFSQGIKTNLYHIVVGSFSSFVHRYIFLKGYKDGTNGLIMSIILSYYVTIMYLKLWACWHKK